MILENKTSYFENEIFGIARRDNNNKRKFLIVNRLQAKHLPVSPGVALGLFSKLGKIVAKKTSGEKVLIIGFAETATAIGASVAAELGRDAFYLHTTREIADDSFKIVEFLEEHSHAVEQLLYCKDANTMLSGIDRIIFVEDEVSTGKTISNFIAAIKKCEFIDTSVKFSVATLINAMPKNNMLSKLNVEVDYLFRIDSESFDEIACKKRHYVNDIHLRESYYSLERLKYNNKKDPRVGVNITEYKSACTELAESVLKDIDLKGGTLLVLGSEEFMYPSLVLGQLIEKRFQGMDVKVHATTRSPILASNEQLYPVYSRYSVKSLYDEKRATYLYNLKKYDTVVIMTDAKTESEGLEEICDALASNGCPAIFFVKWEE